MYIGRAHRLLSGVVVVLVCGEFLVHDATRKWAGVSDWFGPMRFKGGLFVGESFWLWEAARVGGGISAI